MLSLLDRAERRFPTSDTFKVTQSLIDEVKNDAKQARANPVKIAVRLGTPVGFVRYVANELPNPATKFTVHSEDGWGRADMRDFIIARKTAGEDWSQAAVDLIAPQRELYDEGKIELVQGRDGDFVIQYAIPRKKVARRLTRYFEFGEDAEG